MSLALTPIATDNTSGTTPPQSAPESAADATPGENAIKIYIVGAIQHPGIYTLASDARIYQLVQAAGGPTSNANLVALNLAAHLSDGQEIYVPRVGENAPTLTSTSTTTDTTNTSSSSNSSSNTTRVNINTASVDELRQQLHTTSTIAQEIVGYRLQHGPFASVDILQQVVSKSEYAKLKDMVTV
jgi:competence protein ComEA